MYIRNGSPFDITAAFVGPDGTQYPAGWLKDADEATLSSFGITEVADPVYKDPRFYSNIPGDAGQINSVPRPLADVVSMVSAEINTHRDTLTRNGGYKVVVGGEDKWFHSDVFSRSQQIGLFVMGANVPANLKWKTMDGSFVTMTQALAQQIFQAAAASDMAIFAAAEAHKAAIGAAVDVEEIAAYDWRSTGWPETYAGSAEPTPGAR